MQNQKSIEVTDENFVHKNISVFTEVTKLKKDNSKLQAKVEELQDLLSESDSEISLNIQKQNEILAEELNATKKRIREAEKCYLELNAKNKALQKALEVYDQVTPSGMSGDFTIELHNTANLLKYKYPNLDFSAEDILYIHQFGKVNNLDISLNDFWILPFKNTQTSKIQNTIITSIGALRKIACKSGRYGLKFFFILENEDKFLEKVEFFKHNHSIVGCQAVLSYLSEGELLEVSKYILRSDFDKKSNLWAKMPSVMLQKVAEASILRSVFPQLSSVYIADEISCNEEKKQIQVTSCDDEVENA